MDEAGGSFTVRSAPGAGTTVCLQLPLGEHERASHSRPNRPIRMGDAEGTPAA